MAPIMLEVGVLSPVVAMCNAVMILLTSATASVIYYFVGLIAWDAATFWFTYGFITTFLGQAVIIYVLRKYHMASFIVLSIGLMVVLSLIMMTYEVVSSFVENPHAVTQLKGC
jgi:uncharacterized membrane protein YfcA